MMGKLRLSSSGLVQRKCTVNSMVLGLGGRVGPGAMLMKGLEDGRQVFKF